MPISMKGRTGELRCGYQVAAQLGAWEWSPQGVDDGVVDTALTSVDEFWLEQEPLTLALPMGRQQWIWEGVKVVREGTSRARVHLTGKPRFGQ